MQKMGERQRKPHGIMICVPYQGHINPFVNLALKFASKGFTITFVHLEYVHHKLSKAHHGTVDCFSEARQSGLDIRYATISDGLPLEFDRNLQFEEYWEIILRDFPGHVDEVFGKIIGSDTDNAYFLVADSVYGWPAGVAEKYKLVNVSFWTEPALVFSQLYHWDLLKENGNFPFKDDVYEEITYIPGIKSINTRDLVSIYKESGVSTVIAESLRHSFEGVKKAHFILHNTVHELESEALSALNKYQPNYAIGPINFSRNLQTNTVSRSLLAESDCANWLESKPTGSVLYVSFGSFIHTSKQVIEEIAYGLLLSEVNFIWAIRQGILSNGDSDVLPDGFEDKIRDRGLIVQWCNQIDILTSPAIGGFLTHNGWNSTVESIWCGVPMICYPFAFDQPTNRKLVVDDWKIGINLCDHGMVVDRTVVGEKIKSVMNGGGRLREEICTVQRIMQKALENDGSSERNFDRFVKDLEAKIYEKTLGMTSN